MSFKRVKITKPAPVEIKDPIYTIPSDPVTTKPMKLKQKPTLEYIGIIKQNKLEGIENESDLSNFHELKVLGETGVFIDNFNYIIDGLTLQSSLKSSLLLLAKKMMNVSFQEKLFALDLLLKPFKILETTNNDLHIALITLWITSILDLKYLDVILKNCDSLIDNLIKISITSSETKPSKKDSRLYNEFQSFSNTSNLSIIVSILSKSLPEIDSEIVMAIVMNNVFSTSIKIIESNLVNSCILDFIVKESTRLDYNMLKILSWGSPSIEIINSIMEYVSDLDCLLPILIILLKFDINSIKHLQLTLIQLLYSGKLSALLVIAILINFVDAGLFDFDNCNYLNDFYKGIDHDDLVLASYCCVLLAKIGNLKGVEVDDGILKVVQEFIQVGEGIVDQVGRSSEILDLLKMFI